MYGRRVWATGGILHVGDLAHDTGANDLEQLAIGDDSITAILRSPDRPATIVRFDPDDPNTSTVVVDHPPIPIDDPDIAEPRRIEFPTADGATAYGWFYEPCNGAVTAPVAGPDAWNR